MTYEQIARHAGVSSSTIKRRLRGIVETYEAPSLSGGVVHLDVTYWGRNKGLMVGIDSATGVVLYHKWIGHERQQDYIEAVDSITAKGYDIQAVVLDGGTGLEICKQLYIVQMCQYHFLKIIKRKLTSRPKIEASKELLALAGKVSEVSKEEFIKGFEDWLNRWSDFLKEKTINPNTDRWQYTHRSLRSAVRTFNEKLPFLFSCQEYPEFNIPNTNNKIEGVFTALKSSLRNHNGMSQANRERFVVGFFRHMGISSE